MTKEIKALQDTYLKKTTDQASSLDDSRKSYIEKGRSFPVLDYTEAKNGHFLVELGYSAGEWFIFASHWFLSWSEDSEQDNHPYKDETEELSPGNSPRLPEDVDWKQSNDRVSKYFRVSEVTQNDYRRIPTELTVKRNILDLAKELDRVREQWGSAIGVTSWYRPPQINRNVGGVSNSQHLEGSAADVYPVKGNLYEFQEWLDNKAWRDRALGYGAPRGFVHLDMRNSPIRWNY